MFILSADLRPIYLLLLLVGLVGPFSQNGQAQAPRTIPSPTRATTGLLVEYRFEEATGDKVRDVSGAKPPLDLTIENTSAVQWISGGLSIQSPTTLNSEGPARRVTERIRKTRQFTVEAWVRPASLEQNRAARLLGISNGPSLRNFTLDQAHLPADTTDGFHMRTRTTRTDLDGRPLFATPTGTALPGIQHVVYTRAQDGTTHLFINAQEMSTGKTPGTMDNWDSSYHLVIANEMGATNPWLGDLFLMAVYDTALDARQVQNNYIAGSGSGNLGHLSVGPTKDLSVTAEKGKGVVVSSRGWTIHNIGAKPLSWNIEGLADWLKLPERMGELAPGEQRILPLAFNTDAIAKLEEGTYSAKLRFTNSSNTLGSCERTLHLRIRPVGSLDGTGIKPGPHNTGPRDPSALRKVGSITVTKDGALIENVHIEGTLVILANNVTVRNFVVDAKGERYGIRCNSGNKGILLEDGEIYNARSACVFGAGFTARRLNVHESGGDGFKTSNDTVIEYCWVHHLGTAEGAHADAVQSRDGIGMVFRGNFFDIPIDIGAPYKSNACMIIQTGLGPIDDVLIEDNWMTGGNFTLYITDKGQGHGPPTNVRVINNHFGREYRFGLIDMFGYVHLQGNRWDDTGDLMSINNK